MRLVGQSNVSNWQMGRLEIFFEDSWSQVCGQGFGGADADVACRQLGFGAGSVRPSFVTGARVSESPERLVYPKVAITRLGCVGTEASLLECPGEMSDYLNFADICFDDYNEGLALACVTNDETGVMPSH